MAADQHVSTFWFSFLQQAYSTVARLAQWPLIPGLILGIWGSNRPQKLDQDQDRDSLLVKCRNDTHSPGPVIRELVPSSHQRSELSNTIICIFSRWDQGIGEGIPIPDSLGEEATFINICISNGSLKCRRVLISTTSSFGDKVICCYTGRSLPYIRMSKEKSEVRDWIKSDCLLIEIVDGMRLWSILVSAKLPNFFSNNYKMCTGLFIPIINLIICHISPCCKRLWF